MIEVPALFNNVVCLVDRHKAAVAISALYIFLSLSSIGGIEKITRILSPLSTATSFAAEKNIHQTFSFIPGWSYTKLERVTFEKGGTVAFFDIPINGDGTFYTAVDGYDRFRSQDAADLFQRAHHYGSKVVVTLTLSDQNSLPELLDSNKSQHVLIEQTIQEIKETGIDGVNLTFEQQRTISPKYRDMLTLFIRNFTQQLHASLPEAKLSVSITGTEKENSVLDVTALSQSADRIFLMAYNFPTTELTNSIQIAPVFGYAKEQYWKKVKGSISAALTEVPKDKLVLETAWYGNGANYPDVIPAEKDTMMKSHNTLSTPLSTKTIEKLLLEVPRGSRSAARKNLPIIARALENEGILNPNVLAYALATIEHETAETFEPIDEFKGRKNARRLGYEGGANYYGRGFIQLTHLRNYKRMGQRIGMGDALVKNPSLTSKPEVAAKVLAAFFKDNGIASLAIKGEFTAARRPVNPDQQAWGIALLAWKYLDMIS